MHRPKTNHAVCQHFVEWNFFGFVGKNRGFFAQGQGFLLDLQHHGAARVAHGNFWGKGEQLKSCR